MGLSSGGVKGEDEVAAACPGPKGRVREGLYTCRRAREALLICIIHCDTMLQVEPNRGFDGFLRFVTWSFDA